MSRMRYFAASDKGLVRPENEDSYLLHMPENAGDLESKGILAIVADGVGGGPAGKHASSMAVELIRDYYYGHAASGKLQTLQEALEEANLRIFEEAKRDLQLRGMATTCTAMAISRNEGCLSHAGDSRAYLLRGDELSLVSEDHTLVGELVAEGIITAEEGRVHPQRNIILKALGSTGSLTPDAVCIDLRKGDTLLLCSDGLHGYVTDDEIASIMTRNTVEEAGPKLISLALDRGGADNITVVLVAI
jgi:serine/threonine protein phosphatase PrpC